MSDQPAQPSSPPSSPLPRMILWAIATGALMLGALLAQDAAPMSPVAVTLYKAHLMALGGWGGYWLDRALFPYDRPHNYLEDDESSAEEAQLSGADGMTQGAQLVAGQTYGLAMIRRAIIVAACLVCVGLGA